MPNVTFVNAQKTVRVGALSNLRRVALGAGVPLYNGLAKLASSRGAVTCGTCRVHVEPAGMHRAESHSVPVGTHVPAGAPHP